MQLGRSATRPCTPCEGKALGMDVPRIHVQAIAIQCKRMPFGSTQLLSCVCLGGCAIKQHRHAHGMVVSTEQGGCQWRRGKSARCKTYQQPVAPHIRHVRFRCCGIRGWTHQEAVVRMHGLDSAMRVYSLRSATRAAWFEERSAKHAWENWSLAATASAPHGRQRQGASQTVQLFEPHLNTALPRAQGSSAPKSKQLTARRVGMLCVVYCMYVDCCGVVLCRARCVCAGVCCVCGWACGVCVECVIALVVHAVSALSRLSYMSRVRCHACRTCCECVLTLVAHVVRLFFEMFRKNATMKCSKKTKKKQTYTKAANKPKTHHSIPQKIYTAIKRLRQPLKHENIPPPINQTY